MRLPHALTLWSFFASFFLAVSSRVSEGQTNPADASAAGGNTDELARILETSTDREALEKAGTQLAARGQPEAVVCLGKFLRRWEFLLRLDDTSKPQTRRRHLGRIMAALQAHPNPAVSDLCISLGQNRVFLSDPDRMDFVLETLAAVQPMTAEAAALFRRTSDAGYYTFDIPLLVANGSPRALALFEALIQDKRVGIDRRVDCLHRAVLANRTKLPVLESAERLLATHLEDGLRAGLLESLFDYREKEWFGPAANAPRPPAWNEGSNEALRVLLRIADQARTGGNPAPPVLEAIANAVSSIESVLKTRGS
jgi:hypothetical protein